MEYWDELSKEVKSILKKHDSATTFVMIKQLKDGNANVKNCPMQDSDGKILTN